MPFARISLLKGKSPDFIAAISQSLQEALVDAFEVPKDDRFQVFDQYEPGEMVFDQNYLGGPRSKDFILFNITAGRLRSTEVKKAFYLRLVELLGRAPGVRAEDVMVIINTTSSDEWSFSGGKAVV